MRTALAVLTLTALTIVSWPGPIATADACEPEFVAGLGPACLRETGLFEVFGREGQSLGFTHGLDPVPGDDEGSIAATPQDPECVDADPNAAPSRQYYMTVIYARAFDDADQLAAKAGMIRELVRTAQGLLQESAGQVGRSAWLRVECQAGTNSIWIWNAVLPTPLAQTTFSTIVQDLYDFGFPEFVNPRLKLWVFFDDTSACACGGTGHLWGDSALGPSNWNNGNTGLPTVAVNFGYDSPRIMMHELGHNLGAVQNDAPETSGAGHCNDGLDIMCYNDGGPLSNYRTTACAVEVFDCNHNSYFNPNPAAGSYLSTNWNLGHGFNRYIRGCLDGWGRLTASPGVFVAVPNVNVHAFNLPLACQGHLYGVQALPQVQGVQLPTGHNVKSTTVPHDLDVCWFNVNVQVRCDQTLLGTGGEQGVIPTTATRFEVRLRAGAAVDYLFRAM